MPTSNARPVVLNSTLNTLKNKIQLLSESLTPTTQSDWDETDKNEDSFIKNKPENLWTDRVRTGNSINFSIRKARNATNTKIYMEPSQDLNGYDYPWPAGGGKNKLDASTEVVGSYIKDDGTIGTSANASYYDQYIPVTEGQTYTASFTIATDNPGYYFRIHGYDTDKEWVQMLFKSSTTITSAGDYSFSCTIPSGIKYVRISFGSYARNMMLEQGSTASDYAPYSNICSISGRTSVSLNGCGKNLYEFPFKNKLSLSGSGNNRTIVSTIYKQASIIRLKPNTNYYLSGDRTEASDVYARLATFGSYPKAGDVSIRFLSYKNDTGLTFTTSDDELWALVFETSGYDDDCHMQLELGSSASSYESYQESNDVTITFPATGKNQFNKATVTSGCYFDVDGNIQSASNTSISDYIEVSPNVTYYFSQWYTQSVARYFCYYDANKNFLDTFRPNYDGKAITMPSNVKYIRASIKNELLDTFQIEKSSQASSYEPYTNTCYGGTLDVEKGELVVDKGYFVFDTYSKINSMTSSGSIGVKDFYRFQFDTPIRSPFLASRGCSHFVNAIINTTSTDYGYYAYTSSSTPNSGNLQFRNRNLFTNLEDCKAWFTEQLNNGKPVQCWFTLENPITISLTPEQVQLLKGHNTIWTDGDNIELKYIDDEKNISDVASELNSIFNEMGPVEEETAQANYSVGDYLLLNNHFYKVISPIVEGDTITVGTNVTATTIGAELTALNT